MFAFPQKNAHKQTYQQNKTHDVASQKHQKAFKKTLCSFLVIFTMATEVQTKATHSFAGCLFSTFSCFYGGIHVTNATTTQLIITEFHHRHAFPAC